MPSGNFTRTRRSIKNSRRSIKNSRRPRITQKQLDDAVAQAFDQGRRVGATETQKRLEIDIEKKRREEGYEARVALAKAYAVVFEAIAKSSVMFLDTGAGLG